ncbi:MAG: GDSL-type esterase/lipase family protein, partial [Rhodosalinus sp.]
MAPLHRGESIRPPVIEDQQVGADELPEHAREAPVALRQGRQLRQDAIRLPEAPGERGASVPGSPPALRLLAVGESPLAGVGLDHPNQTVAARLAELIRQRTDRAVRWQILARGGLTAEAVQKKLLPGLEAGSVDLILIGLGVNDSLALRSARRWRGDLQLLIEALHARLGPAPVLLAGVPDMQRFPLLPFPLSLLLGARARLLDHTAAGLAGSRPEMRHVPMRLDAGSSELF